MVELAIVGNNFEKHLWTTIEPSMLRLGYEVVRIKWMEQGKRNTLQVMLDCADGRNINIDDCERASKQLSALLDVEDVIEKQYDLEVSSPGIDRPLTRPKDFERFAPAEVKIELTIPVNGQKRFRGMLLGITDDNQVRIIPNVVTLSEHNTEEEIIFPFSNILKAKLVLNDDLLAKHEQS